jgi:hypothetical protein
VNYLENIHSSAALLNSACSTWSYPLCLHSLGIGS